MAVRRIVASGGLSTDPTALDQPNALRVAENVLLHRPGSIQVRPGFGDTTGVASRTTDYRPIAVRRYLAGGVTLAQGYDAGSNSYHLEHVETLGTFATSNAAPPDDSSYGVSSFMEARGSFYLTTSTGIRKLTISGPGFYRRAGTWITYQPAAYSLIDPGASSDRIAIPSDGVAAYRWVVKRVDEQGYESRSAPSSRVIVRAPSATYANGARVELGSIYLPADALQADTLELYRTVSTTPSTSDPGEDYYLVATYDLDGTDIANGFVASDIWSDDVANDELGAALYTSQSQLGALASKEPPPLAHSVAWWGSCAWAGNTTERRTLSLWIQKIAYESGATVTLEGVGLCINANGSGDFTSGSAVISNVTFGVGLGWDSLTAGMWIADVQPGATSGRIPAGAKIASWDEGAQTITMDAQAAATAAAQTFKLGDVITVNDVDFYCYTTESLTLRWVDVAQSNSDVDERARLAAESFARCLSAYSASSGTVGVFALKDAVTSDGNGELLLIAEHPEDDAFTVSSSRGGAFTPSLASAVTAEDADKPARIAWSAANEPDAWPPAQTAIVGEGLESVLALAPTNDALFVWKTDGLYAVVGTPPDAWAINSIDSSVRLLSPGCVTTLGGVCFAFTDRGVVAVSTGGVQVISGDIAAELRQYQAVLLRNASGAKRGFWMAAHKRLGLVILGVAKTASAEYSSREYVYHVATGRWSTWTRTDRCMGYDPAEDRMIAAPGVDGWSLLYERSDEDDAASYRDVTISGITGTMSGSVLIVDSLTAFDPHGPPTVGDVVYDESKEIYARVTGVTASPKYHLTLDTSGFSSPVTFTWHQHIPSVVQWQAQQMPGYSSRWSEIHVDLLDSSSEYVVSWPLAVGGATNRDTSATTLDATVDSAVTYSRPVRVGPHRNLVRAAHLYPQIGVSCAGVFWRVGELALHGVPTSRRVAR